MGGSAGSGAVSVIGLMRMVPDFAVPPQGGVVPGRRSLWVLQVSESRVVLCGGSSAVVEFLIKLLWF